MKKLLSVLFVLSFFVTACQSAEEVTTVEVEGETESSVSHYSDRFLSFDYPSDLELLVEGFGEGAIGEKISFLKWSEEDGAYLLAGPGINLSSYGSDAREEFEKDKAENAEEVVLVGAEAYTIFNEFGFCGSYTSGHLLFTYEDWEFYATFAPASICPGTRDEEILDLFLETVSF